MRRIWNYEKQLRDQESITPSHLFEAFKSSKNAMKQQTQMEMEESDCDKIAETQQFDNIKEPKQQFDISDLDLKSLNRLKSRKHKDEIPLKDTGQSVPSEMVKKRIKWTQLKHVLTGQKINVLKDIFIEKLKRNNQFSQPVHYQLGNQFKQYTFWQLQGYEMSELAYHILSVIVILEMMISIVVYSLALIFSQIANDEIVLIIQAFSLITNSIQMIINFTNKKTISGRKLKSFRQIMNNYIRSEFFVDFINILAVILSMSTNYIIFNYVRLIILAKISLVMQKLQKIEIYVIENYYNEQYWSLVKIFLFNFCFAHILAIMLIAMTNVDRQTNWMIVKGIEHSNWTQKYIWSYYWGINIMLTVGFGDIVATTYKEALCLIFIETISCLALAYNINCVGNLISNIRAQDIQKSKNFKIFKKLILKNNLPQQLSWRINNYIDESINIKKKFTFEEEKNFIEKLPLGFKKQVLKQSNKNVFQKITFFRGLMEKTLFSLAEKIQMCIYHPQQIIQPLEDHYHLFILKAGQIGYICRNNQSSLNNEVIDCMKVKNRENPFPINLHFITKKRQNFEVKSLVYSIFYFLEHNKLIDILNESPMDFELYSYLRDKNKNVIDEFQVFPCQFCKTKHTKFHCPKIHFIPISQHIINKYLRKYQLGKNQRGNSMYNIQQYKKINALKVYQQLQDFRLKNHKSVHNIKVKKMQTNRMQNFNLVQIQRKKKSQKKGQKHNSMQSFQQTLIQQTAEVIKEELVKILGSDQYQDQIWNLKLDNIKNYKGYFLNDNSNNLKQKFHVLTRKQGMYGKLESKQGCNENSGSNRSSLLESLKLSNHKKIKSMAHY